MARRRFRRKYKSPFASVAPEAWQHGHENGAATLSTSPGSVTELMYWEAEDGGPGLATAEAKLMKDIDVELLFVPSTDTNTYGIVKVFWYNIPIGTSITTTAIDKRDTRRIWAPRSMIYSATSGGMWGQRMRLKFPKKIIGDYDRFGLAAQVLQIQNSSNRLIYSATYLQTQRGLREG